MDYSRLDSVRRQTTPLQLDVVEAYARERISRREYEAKKSQIEKGSIIY